MSPTITANPPLRAGKREWIGLGVLALPALLLSMDVTVLHMALPHVAADLGATGAEQLWITDIYPFMIAGLLVTMGTLGDRIGRRKLLLIGASGFALASVFTAYAANPGMLIAARALLGIAGATITPSTLSLIATMFKNSFQRATALGIWMTCFSVGAMIGPVVGGLMLESFWWGSVFLLGVPVMVLLLIAGPRLLPEFRTGKGHLDILSVVLSLTAVILVIYGVKSLADGGWHVVPVAITVLGSVVGWLFIRRQRRLERPLLDLNLFTNRPFSAALIVLLGGMATLSALTMYLAQYLQLVEGLSPILAGLWMLPFVAGTTVGLTLAPILGRWLSPAIVIGSGLVLAAAGYLLLTQLESTSGPLFLAIGSVLVTLGLGPLMVLGTDLIIASAPPERAGSAAALQATSSELGMALGIAILGSVGTATYRAVITNAIPPGLPVDVTNAARDSMAGAVAVAEKLPPDVVAGLFDAAHEAFTTGVNVVALVSGLMLIALAVVSFTMLHPPHSRDAPLAAADPSQPASQ